MCGAGHGAGIIENGRSVEFRGDFGVCVFRFLLRFSSVLGLSIAYVRGPHIHEMFCECLRRSTTVLVHCALSTIQLLPALELLCSPK